jgi:hypothetical protein
MEIVMSLRIWVAALALPLALAACEEPKETGTKVQANVTLPDPPKVPPLPVAAQYENNIYSIAGIKRALILRRGTKVLDTPQVIRGTVVGHYPNPCPPKSKDCLGKKPYFYIADAAGPTYQTCEEKKDRCLTIVPTWEIESKKLEEMYAVGTTADFKGRFVQTALNGFTDAGGLLNLDNPEELPPGAPDPTGLPPKRPPL